jgi:hypothetical protein
MPGHVLRGRQLRPERLDLGGRCDLHHLRRRHVGLVAGRNAVRGCGVRSRLIWPARHHFGASCHLLAVRTRDLLYGAGHLRVLRQPVRAWRRGQCRRELAHAGRLRCMRSGHVGSNGRYCLRRLSLRARLDRPVRLGKHQRCDVLRVPARHLFGLARKHRLQRRARVRAGLLRRGRLDLGRVGGLLALPLGILLGLCRRNGVPGRAVRGRDLRAHGRGVLRRRDLLCVRLRHLRAVRGRYGLRGRALRRRQRRSTQFFVCKGKHVHSLRPRNLDCHSGLSRMCRHIVCGRLVRRGFGGI